MAVSEEYLTDMKRIPPTGEGTFFNYFFFYLRQMPYKQCWESMLIIDY